jgi:protein gp37
MSENSSIEWTDHTFNPWEGCQKVGPGCDHCYAETRNVRFGGGTAVNWGPGAPRRRTSSANWRKPLAWNRTAGVFYAQHRRKQRVFCASLADVFDNAVDPQWRADLFNLIEQTPNLDWLLLTKRIGNVERMVPEATDLIEYGEGWQSMWGQGVWPENVWLGATIVNQEEADRDIPKLLAVPARRRFLSMEPLLGPVDLTAIRGQHWAATQHMNALTGEANPSLDGIAPKARVDWVIVGGESGPQARPMHPDWARDLRDQCAAAGVPFLLKQWGEWAPGENAPGPQARTEQVAWFTFGKTWDFGSVTPKGGESMHIDDSPDVWRFGKKAAGRHLDGVTHNAFPGDTA